MPTATVIVNLIGEINNRTTTQFLFILSNQLQSGTKDFRINIPSPGGGVFHGITIYNFLIGLKGIVLHTHNLGQIDSVANLIYMAGNVRTASTTSTFLLHPPRAIFPQGAYTIEDLRERVQGLESDERKLAEIIASRLTKPVKEVQEMFQLRKTYTSKEAKTLGFATKIEDFAASPDTPLYLVREMPDRISISGNFDTPYRLKELLGNLRFLQAQPPGGSVEIQCEFASPFAVTPLAARINAAHLRCTGLSSYLQRVHFPAGLDINACSLRSTYLPLLRIQKAAGSDLDSELLQLHSCLLDLLKSPSTITDPQFLELITENALGYLIGEQVTNVQEHSLASDVYVFAQYWPRSNAIEICILDNGLGFMGSLQRGGRDVKSHQDAMEKVLTRRLSAKNEGGEIYRGTGLWTTRQAILNQEIRGEFLLLSGDTAF